MSEWVDIPLTTQFGERNQGSASPSYVSDTDLLNLELLQNPQDTRRPFHIAGVPGWQHVPTQPGGAGEFLGMGAISSGRVFVTRNLGGSRTVYSSTTPGSAAWTSVSSNIGSSPCAMADAGTHMVSVDGTNVDVVTADGVTNSGCNRGNFNGVAYQDGYTVFTESGSNSLYASNLDDPTTVDALRYTTVDGTPGDCVGVISNHRELYVFKQRSIEHFYNAGGSGFPFVRASPGVIERGCWVGTSDYGSRTIAKHGRSLFWLGDDRRVYTMSNYSPVAISNEWVERLIESVINQGNDTSITGGTYVHNGNPYYILSSSDFGSNFHCLVYSIKTGLWHRRKSSFSSTAYAIGFAENHISANTNSHAFVAVNYGSNGYIARLRNDVSDVDSAGSGTALTRTIVLPQLYFGGLLTAMHELRLDAGAMTLDADGITLQWSDDGGATYNTGRVGGTAAPGLRWLRLGAFKHRILKLTVADDVAVQIMGLRALIEVGAS